MRQPSYIEGGARVHLCYALAPLFAVLKYLFAPPGVFLCLHLLMVIAAGISVTVYFLILRSRMPSCLAFLWVFAAAANPIWSGQTASLYIEIPMSALLSLSAYFFWKGQYGRASLYCFLAYFMKDAATLQAAVYAVLAMAILIMSFYRHTTLRTDWRFLYLFIPAPLMMFLDHLVGADIYLGPFSIQKLPHFIVRAIHQTPYLYPTLVMEGVIIAGLLTHVLRRRHTSFVSNVLDRPEGLWLLMLVILTYGFWSSFMITRYALVRYTVMIHLPMICLLAFLLSGHSRLSYIVAGMLLSFNLANQQGWCLTPLPRFIGRSGDRLERSREYLTDLAADRTLCKLLEDHAADEPIVTKAPFTQMLRIPELGYVRQALRHVIEAKPSTRLANALSWKDLPSVAKDHWTLCIYSPTIFEMDGPSLVPRDKDVIVWTDTTLPTPLLLFRRKWKDEELSLAGGDH